MQDATMTPEAAIARYARTGDADAFAALVRQYQCLAFAAASRKLARREDAEDATQQAFLNLARAAGTVRRDVAAWLYRAAQHAAIDLIRRDATRRRHESTLDAPAEATTDAAIAEWRELSAAIDDAIAALPDEERSLVLEHFLAGRSQRDLAVATGLSQPTIQRRLTSAVDRLREHLTQAGHTALGGAAIATHLPTFGQANVPTTVTAELTKVGLAAPAKVAVGVGAKLTIGATLAAGVALVAAVAIPRHATSIVTTAPAAPTYADAPAALAALSQTYRLRAGEDLAVFPPPHPPARGAFVWLEFPETQGPENVAALAFTEGKDGLSTRQMSYVDQTPQGLIEGVMNVDWWLYDATAIDALKWKPAVGDWVARAELTLEQRLAAVASLAGKETGRAIHFERRMERRPCVVHAGTSDRETPEDDGHLGTAWVALQAPSADLLHQLADHKVPAGVKHAFQFDVASRWLDAPFFWRDQQDRMLDSRIFYVPRDSQLSRRDPDYRDKLRRILDNVAAQVGGTWTIEDREIETWVAVVGAK